MPRTRPQKLATLDAVEEIARRVPGYRGYQDLTQRHEDDRRFRSGIAEHLNAEAHRLERIEGRQFGEDYSDLLEEVDAGARRLEYLAESLTLEVSSQKTLVSDRAADEVGSLDRRIVEDLDRLHSVVHELEKAYDHDERFAMNLAELRSIMERMEDQIAQRAEALGR